MSRIAQDMPEDVMRLMNSIAFPLDRVAHNCHAVSLAIVKSGIYPGARVARGTAVGVAGQHSWVVADFDPELSVYDPEAHIIDATLWSYDETVPRVWQGTYEDEVHRPHGWGHFLESRMPVNLGGRELRLRINRPSSQEARDFLAMLGPLDAAGWSMVGRLPVGGWPAREIIGYMLDTPGIDIHVPIDIEGHLTDRNPGGVYF